MNSCKFGEQRAYNQELSKVHTDVTELVEKINNLENTVKAMNAKISSLETELQIIMNKTVSDKTEFSCDKCEYRASSKIVLKRHKTSKHKHISLQT